MKKENKNPVGIIILMLVIIIGCVALGGGYYVLQSDTKGANRDSGYATIQIESGETSGTIIQKLKQSGLIKYDFWYKLYLKKTGEGSNFQVGTFELNKNLSYSEITKELSKVQNFRETVRVTFPEGSTAMQFASILEDAGLCTRDEFLDVANNGDFSDIKFWSKIQTEPNCFMKAEGFLFPETYEFYADETVENIVRKLYMQFDNEITDEMYAQMDSMGLSLNQVITLASLVQEEAGDPVNQPAVAGVFYNRLKPGSPYPKMGSDVTWWYITDFIRPYYNGEIHHDIENNYYTGDEDPNSRKGLPAGPISCPGITAINAALNPEQHDYYFFLTDLTGKYYYAVTYNEHLVNIQTMKSVNATVEQ